MNPEKNPELEKYMKREILALKPKGGIVRKASKLQQIPLEEVEMCYDTVRSGIHKAAAQRAWVYLLLGSLFFGVGLFATLAKTGLIFYGAIGIGGASIVTAAGLFIVALTKRG